MPPENSQQHGSLKLYHLRRQITVRSQANPIEVRHVDSFEARFWPRYATDVFGFSVIGSAFYLRLTSV